MRNLKQKIAIGVGAVSLVGLAGCESLWEFSDPFMQLTPKLIQPSGYRDWKDEEKKINEEFKKRIEKYEQQLKDYEHQNVKYQNDVSERK